MRLLAPLLVLSTLTVLGSGVALLVLGPEPQRDVVLGLHKTSFVVWFVVMSVHVLVYAPRLPRLLVSSRTAIGRKDRRSSPARSLAGAVLAGAPRTSLAGPWLHRAHEHEREGAYAPR